MRKRKQNDRESECYLDRSSNMSDSQPSAAKVKLGSEHGEYIIKFCFLFFFFLWTFLCFIFFLPFFSFFPLWCWACSNVDYVFLFQTSGNAADDKPSSSSKQVMETSVKESGSSTGNHVGTSEDLNAAKIAAMKAAELGWYCLHPSKHFLKNTKINKVIGK